MGMYRPHAALLAALLLAAPLAVSAEGLSAHLAGLTLAQALERLRGSD
jgi:hypothetical protein